MSFPEPKTIPEYQAQLLRAWGAVLRAEEHAREILEEATAIEEQALQMKQRALALLKTIQGVKAQAQ